MLDELRQLFIPRSGQDAFAEHFAYLKKRQEQMRYPEFVQQGWLIGSGIVESANKLVVEARLKGAGMHWQPDHVNPMLALRTILAVIVGTKLGHKSSNASVLKPGRSAINKPRSTSKPDAKKGMVQKRLNHLYNFGASMADNFTRSFLQTDSGCAKNL